ncbi:nuclear factor 7, brain-like [Parambassis ranga]|uniref:Nuclear factor 7, brain-like n=1 Tax=Parambassis ranga TaxID=210632 RepID=A0A6P7J081_9TELE|nr:nuclear factor 7, brain-like [Parambassis ranga]
MKDKVHFSPVILDPNTANRWLYLSDDLTSVRHGDTEQKLPDNPERYSTFTHVLGSEGFGSGKHSWEVEVGDHPDWNVGLAKESVDRYREKVPSPEYGIWCLDHGCGKYVNCVGKPLRLQKNPQRIRVQLDYDGGEVSFYNSEDMTHIYTHRDTFTEKLLPYFGVGKSVGSTTTDIEVCQSEVSLRCSEM